MKQFTIKDFIGYNNPCFSCGKPIIFRICTKKITINDDPYGATAVVLRPTVSIGQTEVDLKVTYTETLKLWIFHQTNKIISSSFSELTEYLKTHALFLQSDCDSCGTSIQSDIIRFNLDKAYINPVGIKAESLIVLDDKNMYEIFSSFDTKKSFLLVSKLDKASTLSPLRLELPLFPIYKFKDRNKFLDKMKTYLIFS